MGYLFSPVEFGLPIACRLASLLEAYPCLIGGVQGGTVAGLRIFFLVSDWPTGLGDCGDGPHGFEVALTLLASSKRRYEPANLLRASCAGAPVTSRRVETVCRGRLLPAGAC